MLKKRTRVYEGQTLAVELDAIVLPNGHEMELELINHPGGSAVVPLLADDQVVMIYQYRYAAGGFLYEIPAGKRDQGEDPLLCAKRELQEETGYCAQHYTHLLSFLTSPGFCNEVLHLYLAESLEFVQQGLEASELLTVEKIPLTTCLDMIEKGEIIDGKTIIGLQAAYQLKQRRQ